MCLRTLSLILFLSAAAFATTSPTAQPGPNDNHGPSDNDFRLHLPLNPEQRDAFLSLWDDLGLSRNAQFQQICPGSQDPRSPDSNPCSWCDSIGCCDGWLNLLNLSDLGLSGTFPYQLFSFNYTASLDLSNNSFHGSLPDVPWNFTYMTALHLSNNKFEGLLPPGLSLLTELDVLDLANNHLEGQIPSSIGNLHKLDILNLGYNSFSGSIPDIFSGLGLELKILKLSGNALIGTLPNSMRNLSALIVLSASSNRLTGSISNWLSLPNLALLDLSFNSLTGDWPRLSCPSLASLNLGFNSLEAFPALFSSLPHLKVLAVPSNMIAGSLPQDICQLRQLISLDISGNLVQSTIPRCFGELRHLKQINMSHNHLTGSLPDLLPANVSLRTIDVSFNLLSSRISSFAAFAALSTLKLDHNQLTGSIDGILNPGHMVTELTLSDNRLSGTLPEGIFLSSALETLVLSINCFSGALPQFICAAHSLQYLVLTGLNTACIIPAWGDIGHTMGLTATTSTSRMTGSIPGCIFSLSRLRSLHLSGNGLIGNAKDIVIMPDLAHLSMSHNRLVGTVPQSVLQRVSRLDRLDLAFNCIAGTIDGITPPKVLSLIDNRLSGNVPESLLSSDTQPQKLSILEGNSFQCSTSRSDLPQGDPYLSSFSCGSQELDEYSYSFWGLSAGVLLLLVRVLRGRMLGVKNADTETPVLSASVWDIFVRPPSPASLREEPNLAILYETRAFASLLSLLVLLLLLPVYSVLNAGYKTHEYVYSWALSIGFKSGVVPSGMLVAFITCLLLLAALLSRIIWGGGSRNTLLSPGFTSSVKQSRNLTIMLSIVTIDLAFFIGANVGYLHVVTTASSTSKVFAKLWFGIVNFITNQAVMKAVDALGAGNQSFYWKTVLFLVNSVLIPCAVTAATISSCFKYALMAAPSSMAVFSSRTCGSTFTFEPSMDDSPPVMSISEDCVSSFDSITYQPLVQYNFACSTTLLTVYAPTIIAAASVQVLELFANVAFAWAKKRFSWTTMSPTLTHYLLATFSSRFRTAKNPSFADYGANLRKLQEGYHQATIQDLAMLLTYGLASPAIALSLAACIVFRSLVQQYATLPALRGSYRAFEDTIGEQCDTGGQTGLTRGQSMRAVGLEVSADLARANPMQSVRTLLLVVPACFFGLFCADMGGDQHGAALSGAMFTCMALLPPTLAMWALLLPFAWRKSVFARMRSLMQSALCVPIVTPKTILLPANSAHAPSIRISQIARRSSSPIDDSPRDVELTTRGLRVDLQKSDTINVRL